MTWKVVEVIDGDTFRVSPQWKWKEESGDRIRPTGYDVPEEGQPGHDEAREKLKRIVSDKEVELKNPVDIDRGRLVCDVFVDGKNLASFFPEYQ